MTFRELTAEEKQKLESAPVLISLLVSGADPEMNEKEKKEALHFSHIKTFTADPLLREFYRDVEKGFEERTAELDRELPKERKEREEEIKKRLASIEPILEKLGKTYTILMHQSLNSYYEHVSKAHRTVVESFLVPIYIKGFSD
ncbi:MAG TPA: hypothetical protein VI112_17850 [Bacteroidia bacterium]|jgi:hypothetical protein